MTSTERQIPVIELSDVEMRYDPRMRPVLSDINLSIYAGDFLAVSGPNGGGKTTLLRIILRLLRPTAGTVVYRDAAGKEMKALHIGYLPQKSAIDVSFPVTVREVILSGLLKGLRHGIKEEDKRQLEHIVQLTDTSKFLDSPIGSLSGGQLQRTLLARAIISKPDILVLDEPLSYVDKRFEQQIYGIIEDLARHTTVILVSHEMSIISGMANRHVIVDHKLEYCHALHHYIPTSCTDSEPDKDIKAIIQ